jgi:hypothetical protein
MKRIACRSKLSGKVLWSAEIFPLVHIPAQWAIDYGSEKLSGKMKCKAPSGLRPGLTGFLGGMEGEGDGEAGEPK